jgi:hypothetical protein
LDANFENISGYHLDITDLQNMRVYLADAHNKWAKFIYGPLPQTDRDIPASKNKTGEPGKDTVYQLWRSKFNNDTKYATPDAKEKLKKSRQKSFTMRTKRGVAGRTAAGLPVCEYGTLIGFPTWEQCGERCQSDFKKLEDEMGKKIEADPSLTKQLVQLWETQFSLVSGIKQKDFETLFELGGLSTLSKFKYYEAYTKKICQLPHKPKDQFVAKLHSFAEVVPFLFGGKKEFFFMKDQDDYRNTPCLMTLLAISNYFGESDKILLRIPGSVTKTEDLMDWVLSKKICNAVLDYDKYNTDNERRFGVVTQGVPFIRDLTEEEVCAFNTMFLS